MQHSLWKRFEFWLNGYLKFNSGGTRVNGIACASELQGSARAVSDTSVPTTSAFPFDEALLERARTQWQFGDWPSLAAMTREKLEYHPDRAKLALLAAAGHQQQGDHASARRFALLAQDWGCSKRTMAQMLVAGVHNTLARAAVVSGQLPRALNHFHASISVGAPGSDIELVTQARVTNQSKRLKLELQRNILAEDRDGMTQSQINGREEVAVDLTEAVLSSEINQI